MAHNKFLPRVLAAAAAMMLLAGCGSKANPGFSPANPVNITIWTYYNGEQLEAFNALVDEFNSTVGKEQGITVESSSHGSVTDLENNVLSSAEGKVGAEAMPNIFSVKCSQFPSCVDFTGFNCIQNCVYCYYLSFFSKIALKHRPHYFHI